MCLFNDMHVLRLQRGQDAIKMLKCQHISCDIIERTAISYIYKEIFHPKKQIILKLDKKTRYKLCDTRKNPYG